jgi:hypothetical protein
LSENNKNATRYEKGNETNIQTNSGIDRSNNKQEIIYKYSILFTLLILSGLT